MSTSFEIFPTRKKIPSCSEIIEYSVQLFYKFLERKNIDLNIKITVREVDINANEINSEPGYLTSDENYCTAIRLNEIGEAYIYFHNFTELDKEFWSRELQENIKAKVIKEKIDANLNIGYSWSIKRTMGQPAIVSLYYGYLAIAIAVLTDGIIYSDDGAWDYISFPIEGRAFEDRYLNIETLNDNMVKENVKKWIAQLKGL